MSKKVMVSLFALALAIPSFVLSSFVLEAYYFWFIKDLVVMQPLTLFDFMGFNAVISMLMVFNDTDFYKRFKSGEKDNKTYNEVSEVFFVRMCGLLILLFLGWLLQTII